MIPTATIEKPPAQPVVFSLPAQAVEEGLDIRPGAERILAELEDRSQEAVATLAGKEVISHQEFGVIAHEDAVPGRDADVGFRPSNVLAP